MAILAAGLINVYLSIDAYLTANMVNADGSSIALRLHGVRRFVPPTSDPWIEAHYDFLGLQNTFKNRDGMGTGPPILASEKSGYLQLNLYQRALTFAQRYVTSVIRDTVVAAFPEGGLIPVLHYDGLIAGETPDKEGFVIIDGVQEHVVDTAIHSGVIQHIVQVQTRYIELYSRDV